MVKLAINGFGRIGRLVFREAMKREDVQVVAINDLTDAKMLAHLLKYDSVHGIYDVDVSAEKDAIIVNGEKITVYEEKDPVNIPWKAHDVDIVIESTGVFRTKEGLEKHIEAGAKRAILSAPAKGEGVPMFVMGVNNETYNPEKDVVVSNASCTTNGLAPIAKVLNDTFGVKRGMMTTIHSYTTDQRLLDLPHDDYRRARAAALSMLPTTTGAASAVTKVIPELAGKLDGMAVRVPTPDVSMIDFVVELEQNATAERVNEAFEKASKEELEGILAYTELPLVSVDYTGNTASTTVDGLSTMLLDDNFVKVISWYDNEAGYAARCIDLAAYMMNQQ